MQTPQHENCLSGTVFPVGRCPFRNNLNFLFENFCFKWCFVVTCQKILFSIFCEHKSCCQNFLTSNFCCKQTCFIMTTQDTQRSNGARYWNQNDRELTHIRKHDSAPKRRNRFNITNIVCHQSQHCKDWNALNQINCGFH